VYKLSRRIRLVTDSSCDLPQNILQENNIHVVPLNVLFDDESFVSGVEIDNETFYSKMKNSTALPKTSSPSPDRFLEKFDCEEEEILVICISSGLSSTYNNALIAKNMYLEGNSSKKIEVIDTLSGSLGIGILVLKAVELINSGKPLDEIISIIEKEKENISVYVALDTLENAVKGGRIHAFAGKIINALNLKVIVKVEEGLVKTHDKARGEVKSIKKLVEIMEEHITDRPNKVIGIAHGNCEEKALKLKSMIEEKYNFKTILMSEIGPIIGTYAAEGALLISFN
jgi:DegV family protein with EDD domain